MAKSDSKKSSGINYLWSVLMIICILLLTAHLIISAKLSIGKSDTTIEKTFTERK
jgi:hypothetical protein